MPIIQALGSLRHLRSLEFEDNQSYRKKPTLIAPLPQRPKSPTKKWKTFALHGIILFTLHCSIQYDGTWCSDTWTSYPKTLIVSNRQDRQTPLQKHWSMFLKQRWLGSVALSRGWVTSFWLKEIIQESWRKFSAYSWDSLVCRASSSIKPLHNGFPQNPKPMVLFTSLFCASARLGS